MKCQTMTIKELASKRYCLNCDNELESFNLNFCDKCLTKELKFRSRKGSRKNLEPLGIQNELRHI